METVKQDWGLLPYSKHDLRDLAYCSECPLKCTKAITFVPFEIVGSNPHPRILFVAESPFEDEIKQGRPLIGKAGTLLRDFLVEYIKEYALANTVACHPTDVRKIHKPTNEMIEYCSTHVRQFIQQIQPKIVVLLGEHAIRGFLPDPIRSQFNMEKFLVGDFVRRQPDYIDGILYAYMYHPSYIARKGGLKTSNDEAVAYHKRFEQILALSPKDKVEPKHSLVTTFHTMDSLGVVLRSLEQFQDVGLDYEALDLDPWKTTNKPTGFSLSVVVEGERGRAYFISIDREPTEKERDTLLKFFREKMIWSYNAKFEMNMTWSWLGERIHFNDAFVLCKIDCSPTSLKGNAQRYIGADFWEEQVYDIVGLYEQVFEQADKLRSDFGDPIDDLLEGKYEEFLTFVGGLDEKKQKKFKKLNDALDNLLGVVGIENLMWGLQQYPYAWGAVPTTILGKYCGWDSFLTLKLKDHFWEKYNKYYPYYRSQTWLAGTMEAYGYNWDDTRAEELYQYYIEEAVECLYQLIQRLDIEDEQKQDAECRYYDKTTSSKEKLDSLKDIFNPLSNDPNAQAPFWRAYKTPEVETWAFFNYLEHEILQHEDLDDTKFMKVIDKTNLDTSVRSLYAAAETNDENGAITGILRKSEGKLALYFQRFAIEVTEFQYEAHTKYGGVDIDNEESWNNPFYMLYYLKRFKKVMKSESTYIRGKIGRQSVARSDYTTLTEPPRRVETYFKCPTHKLEDNQRWILNASFFENGADTKRWRAGIHTVPASSELREIYTPRSSSALMFHVDYAQNEVRFLAALAKEENLLAAFKSGIDIHTYVASRIFKKDPKEVTKQERRWAKTGTFGLLYGKTVVSFAQDMMGGDLEAAQRFFDDFFAAFPGVQAYIDACHAQVLRHGFVETMFGDPIYIDQTRYREDEVLRRAQNYPIQSSASSLGAHAIALLNETVIRRGIQAIPLGFCHDAADWEVEICDLLLFLDLMHKHMVTDIIEHHHVPVGVDWAVGVSQNFMMELAKKEDSTYHFSCPKETFEKIITRLQTRFVVDYTIEKEDEGFVSLGELFLNRRAFSKYLGQKIPIYEGQLSLAA